MSGALDSIVAREATVNGMGDEGLAARGGGDRGWAVNGGGEEGGVAVGGEWGWVGSMEHDTPRGLLVTMLRDMLQRREGMVRGWRRWGAGVLGE